MSASATLESPVEEQAGQTFRLGEQLLRAGLLTQHELEAALNQQQAKRGRLGEVLTEMGFVDEEDLLPFVGLQLGMPAVRLREGLVDPEVVQLIPRAKAERLQALALFCVRGELTVALAEPQNLLIIDELERITGLKVRPVVALRNTIEKLIPRCYEDDYSVDAVTADMEADAVELHPDAIEVDLQDVRSLAEGSPVVNLVNYIIVHAVRQHASDIHIEPGHRHSSVRFRVDGQLREVLRPRREFHPAIISRIKVMAKMDIAEQRMPQDGRMHVVVERREIDLRCSTLPTVIGEKAVLRVLDRDNVTFDLSSLGMQDEQLKAINEMLRKPYGLVLATGPTGSGKTTTMYSAIELIKSIHRNIVTVEDPVEYQLELINQVQTSGSRSLSFANVLRSILRQDPDVIMVGEIRDAETAEVAIQAALTGHLVLSTLHTNDSASAVTRLLDMGIASYKIAAALVGVIAQRLVRNVCPNCQTSYYPTAEFLQMIRYTGDLRRPFTKGEGCEQCHDTGFQGRTGLYEVLTANREMRRLIASEADLETLRECYQRLGGRSLLEEGILLAEEGKTSLEEVVRVAMFD
ncbi:MAG: Flp pilus assembly complex ATPase component TadA [Planctomycetaceae bacterium]|nr:Flp pilus assembly complex ATPase component TadA [Planctomycetaceae bacterium]